MKNYRIVITFSTGDNHKYMWSIPALRIESYGYMYDSDAEAVKAAKAVLVKRYALGSYKPYRTYVVHNHKERRD